MAPTKQLSLAAQLEEARDRAAAARAEADRAVQPVLSEVARLEAEAARLEHEVAERQAAHEQEVREAYQRRQFLLGPYRAAFTAAIQAGDLNGAFAVYRKMRQERNELIAAGDVFGYVATPGGNDEPKFADWLQSAFSNLDNSDRDAATTAIRAELAADAA